jgi:hypothetical protein
MFPPWAWVVIAIVVVIIIVVIVVVVVTSSTPTQLYRIQNLSSDLYLDIIGNILIVSTTGTNFSLSLDSSGSSYYVKSAANSSKVLTYESGAADGSLISLKTNTGLSTQSWVIQSTSADSDIFLDGQILQFKPLDDISKSMDFLNPSYTVNYQVGLYTSNNGINQKWKLVPV